jgi:hypothetical protein
MVVEKYLLAGAVIISLIIVGYLVMIVNGADENLQQNETSNFNVSYKAISSGTTGSGDVSIELEPIDVSENSMKVKVSINTHSVDLGEFDLMKITTLEYNGKTVQPTSAPSLGGHHVYDTLVFDTDERPGSFTIRIKGIPKVQERIFDW